MNRFVSICRKIRYSRNPSIVVSSDLNGTLVHEHTMSDMILKYLDVSSFEKAKTYFDQQTSGKVSMEVAFNKAGPLTKGLKLRETVDYTADHMTYVDGFDNFLVELERENIAFVINSTGYSVTIESIRQLKGEGKIHGFIGNYLKFEDEERYVLLSEQEIKELIIDYFHGSDPNHHLDSIVANGQIELGIYDESAKASLILEYCDTKLGKIEPQNIIHIGDTMGDSLGILNIAKLGGKGIAFNYNQELEDFLRNEIEKNGELEKRIFFVDEKGFDSDIRNTLPIIFSDY